MQFQTFFAYDPEDTEEIRSEKSSIFLVSATCTIAGLFWALMYYFLFGFALPTILPALFTVIVGTAIVIAHYTKNHHYAAYAQVVCIIYITTLIQWSIGGIFDSGFVMLWAFIGPMVTLMFLPIRKSFIWLLLYLVNLVVTVIYDDFFALHGQHVPDNIRTFFFILNSGISSLVIFTFAGYFVNAAVSERARANTLLLNVLPKKIAEILKLNNQTIAERFDSASVLFADLVGSTPLFAELEPTAVVTWLNQIISALDTLVEKHGLEKIRTIGDGYMVASGVPEAQEDHAVVLASFALDLLDEIKNHPSASGREISFRVGINSGPMVGGVIGRSKFQYDVWGDTVNVASRMESHGQAGKIQISKNTHKLIKDKFDCEYHGMVDVKGKGQMETWFLLRAK